MENANCTFYMGARKVRGRIGGMNEFGLYVAIPVEDFVEYTGEKVGANIASVTMPGIPSYLITIDDSVTIIEQVVSDGLLIDSIRTIEHDVSNWQWRDENLKCKCGSIDYKPLGHGLFRCNDCNGVLSNDSMERVNDGDNNR